MEKLAGANGNETLQRVEGDYKKKKKRCEIKLPFCCFLFGWRYAMHLMFLWLGLNTHMSKILAGRKKPSPLQTDYWMLAVFLESSSERSDSNHSWLPNLKCAWLLSSGSNTKPLDSGPSFVLDSLVSLHAEKKTTPPIQYVRIAQIARGDHSQDPKGKWHNRDTKASHPHLRGTASYRLRWGSNTLKLVLLGGNVGHFPFRFVLFPQVDQPSTLYED